MILKVKDIVFKSEANLKRGR